MLLSIAASPKDCKDGDVVMVNDVARAFFEAPVGRTVCVELPPEARRPGLDEVGLLEKGLYGTRDASANFQAEGRRIHSIGL